MYDSVQFIEFYSISGSGELDVMQWLMSNVNERRSKLVEHQKVDNITRVYKCGGSYMIYGLSHRWADDHDKILEIINDLCGSGAKSIVLYYNDATVDQSILRKDPEKFSMVSGAPKIVLTRDIKGVMKSRYSKIAELKDLDQTEALTWDLTENEIFTWYLHSSYKNLKIIFEKWATEIKYREDLCWAMSIENVDTRGIIEQPNPGGSIPKHWLFYNQLYTVIKGRRNNGYLKTDPKAEKILLLGDSHIEAFNAWTGSSYRFIDFACHGSTALGCNKRDSQTGAYRIFKRGIDQNQDASRVIISLGEVDAGFAIWLKATASGESPKDVMLEAMNRLEMFINDNLQNWSPEDIILLAPPPVVIEDNTDPRFLNGERASVNTTREERQWLIDEWILELEKRALKWGWSIININPQIMVNGEVDPKYRTPNQWNHHLWPYTTAPLLINALEEL